MKKNKINNQKILTSQIDDRSICVNIYDNNVLMGIVGEYDKNLKLLEKLTDTEIYFRGNSITIKGEKSANIKVKDAIYFLADKYRSSSFIENVDVVSSLNKFMTENSKYNSEVHSIEEIIKTPKRSVIPKSVNQKKYVKYLRKKEIVIASGPAGTGKTYLAVAVALSMLLEKKIERVILSRPAVEAGERLGFLPGDMKDKVDPYMRPFYDTLYDLLDYDRIQKKIESGEIEIAPIAFMRGRTLKNSFAILDEAQNATETQIKMFLTRIGENSKLVVNGDPSQIDLPNKGQSGLIKSQFILKDIKEISVVCFDQHDVIRHPLVTKIVEAYQKNTNDKG